MLCTLRPGNNPFCLASLPWFTTAESLRGSSAGQQRVKAERLPGAEGMKRMKVQTDGVYSVRENPRGLGYSQWNSTDLVCESPSVGKATGQPCNQYLGKDTICFLIQGKLLCPFPRTVLSLTLISIPIELCVNELGILSRSRLRFIYNLYESEMNSIL